MVKYNNPYLEFVLCIDPIHMHTAYTVYIYKILLSVCQQRMVYVYASCICKHINEYLTLLVRILLVWTLFVCLALSFDLHSVSPFDYVSSPVVYGVSIHHP